MPSDRRQRTTLRSTGLAVLAGSMLLLPAGAALLLACVVRAPGWLAIVAYVVIAALVVVAELLALHRGRRTAAWDAFERDFWTYVERSSRSRRRAAGE